MGIKVSESNTEAPSKFVGNAFCFYLTTKCSLHSTQPHLPVVRDCRSRKHNFFQIKQIPDRVAFLERSWDLTSSAREGETGQDKGNGAYEKATGRGRGKRNRRGCPHGSGKVVGGEAEGFIHVMLIHLVFNRAGLFHAYKSFSCSQYSLWYNVMYKSQDIKSLICYH